MATLGVILAGVMGAPSGLVAASGICVPSMVFTLFWGAECGACRSFAGGGCAHAGSTR